MYVERVSSGAGDQSLTLPIDYGVSLSPDGRYLLAGRTAIYDTRTGQRVDQDLPPHAWVGQAAFAPQGTVTYAVGARDKASDDPPRYGPPVIQVSTGPADLLSCELDTGDCHVLFEDLEPPVILPGNS